VEEERRPPMDNITYLIKDGYDMLDDCHEYAMIFIDVDPHDGIQETKMIGKLIEKQYKGIVLLDDIRLNQDMYDMWTSIPLSDEQKIDMTSFGHYSGTGMLLFLSTSSYESSPEHHQSD
jgi:predicted O-methyltransferase YrrM